MKITAINDKLIGGSQRTATVKRNISGSMAIKVVSILTSFLLVPMTLGYVSAEIYGVGVMHGLKKNRQNDCLAKKDYTKGKSMVSTTYAIMFAIFAPFSILLTVVSPSIAWCAILNVDPSNQSIIIKTMQVLFIFISLQMTVNVFVSIVAAYQKTALSNLFAFIGQVCSLCIIGMMTMFIKLSLLSLELYLFSIFAQGRRSPSITQRLCLSNSCNEERNRSRLSCLFYDVNFISLRF